MKNFKYTFFLVAVSLSLFSNFGCSKPEQEIAYKPPIYLSCFDFEEDIVLENNPDAPIDYKINCWIKIKHTLTIKPGTVIVFENNAGLKITEGTIICNGTSKQRIVFKSPRELPGEWVGIVIDRHNNNPNSIEYTDIRDAGAPPESSIDELGSIVLLDSSTLTLKNCVIENGMQTGVNLSYEGVNFINSNNTFINCLQPIRILFSEVIQIQIHILIISIII